MYSCIMLENQLYNARKICICEIFQTLKLSCGDQEHEILGLSHRVPQSIKRTQNIMLCPKLLRESGIKLKYISGSCSLQKKADMLHLIGAEVLATFGS